MQERNDPQFYSTVPISRVICIPAIEITQMNGFAWSAELGLLVAAFNNGQQIEEIARSFRETDTQAMNY